MIIAKVMAGIIGYIIMSVITTIILVYVDRKAGEPAQKVYEGEIFYMECVGGLLFPISITLIVIMAICKFIKIMCVAIVETKIAIEKKDEGKDKTEVELIIEVDKENKNKRMNSLEKAKEIVKTNYKSADCGIFNSRNVLGDRMITIHKDEGLTIDICYDYAYFEVFGLTDEEFKELEKYYNNLKEEERNEKNNRDV